MPDYRIKPGNDVESNESRSMRIGMIRIVFGIGFYVAIIALAGFLTHGKNGLGMILLMLLGMVIGPFMAMAFPFSVFFKAGYALMMTLALASVAVGFWHRRYIAGQIAVVVGFIIWSLLGFIGLGTGT